MIFSEINPHLVRRFPGWPHFAGAKKNGMLPSGNLTWLLKITIFNGKIHYFYGHFQ